MAGILKHEAPRNRDSASASTLHVAIDTSRFYWYRDFLMSALKGCHYGRRKAQGARVAVERIQFHIVALSSSLVYMIQRMPLNIGHITACITRSTTSNPPIEYQI